MGHHNHHHDHHHHHGHHHGHGHVHDYRSSNKKALAIALVITVSIMAAEFIGGLLTNSLALISDSGHMLSDASSLALSLVAMWFASKPPSPNKTYGFYRFEILAALFNGVTLFFIAALIVFEAAKRFADPAPVLSGHMILIALVGLLANLLSAFFLMRTGDVEGNLNLRSAYLHVLSDALGSVGAIIAGLIMYFFQWYIVDPVISVIVAILILRSAWGVIKHSVHILMEGTPLTIDMDDVKGTLENIEGVINVHDLHIWTITSGLDSLSCHLLIEDHYDSQLILQEAINRIEEKYKILHTTIQIEKSDLQHAHNEI